MPFIEAVDILDSFRKPINRKERDNRILNKKTTELFPYYGATGQVGYIDDYLLEGEYVLLGEDGAPFLDAYANKAYMITGKSWVNNHAHILRSKYNNSFLCYYLNYFNYKGYVSGTTRLKLTQSDMKRIPIPVPPIAEQERIVSQIEESLSQLDSAVETLKKTKQQLEVYRLSALKDVFMKTTPMTPFKSITESRLGKMLDKEKNTGIMREYLRNINVRWFDFDLSDLLEMRIEDKETEKYSIEKGDLVICEGGEPGRCAVWESNDTVYYQKALHRVRFTDGSNPKYYMYYLWFINRIGSLSKYFTGTGIKHLTGQSLAKVPVPSISVQRQNEAVSYIEDRFYSIDQVDKILNQSLQQAEALRQSILRQAFKSKLY